MGRTQYKLTDVCNIQYGYAFDSKKFTDNSENIALIRIRDVKSGKSHTYYSGDYDNAYVVNAGDILIGMDGEFNIAKWKSEPALLNQRVCKITPNKEVNADYLQYYLSVELKNIEARTSFVTVKHLSAKELNALALEMHNSKMQTKIAQTLGRIEKLIEAEKEQINNYDVLIKSRFVEMFGDSEYNTKELPIYKLGDLCKVGSSKRIYQNEQCAEGIPFLRISDLSDRINQGAETCELYISNDKYEELLSQRLVPVKDDILVTSRGTLGKCYIVKDTDKFYFQDGMISWLSDFDERVTSIYIAYLFAMPGIQKQIVNLQAGSTVTYLSIAMLKKLDIMLPSLCVQEQFATFVQQVDKLKVEIQKSLEKTQLLYESLMQEYFGQY